MSGRERGGGCGRGHGRDRGSQSIVGNPCGYTNKRKGLCAALVYRLFTYIEKVSAKKIQTSLKHIVKHTATIYGQDVGNELQNRKLFRIYKPQHT